MILLKSIWLLNLWKNHMVAFLYQSMCWMVSSGVGARKCLLVLETFDCVWEGRWDNGLDVGWIYMDNESFEFSN